MPKNGMKKKKEYQKICKEAQLAGKINDASGKFVSANAVPSNSMSRDYFGGVRNRR